MQHASVKIVTSEQVSLASSLHLYRREIYTYPRQTRDEEQLLITRARAGDAKAREDIMQGCLKYVLAIAVYYRKFLRHDDGADLVGIGNLAIAENIDRALTKENPYGYLQVCAKLTIIRYCRNHSHACEWELMERDALRSNTVPPVNRSYDWLYQAIEQLPQQQRDMLTKHFGLYGERKESLYQIGRQLSSNTKGSMAYATMYRALRNLRMILVQTSGGQE